VNFLKYLGSVDYSIIFIYFLILVGLGIYLKRKASASIEDYFIGGRRIPWWALGISGMASWLDITGTMIIVSFIYMLGPRGLFIEFRGGVGLVLIITLLWTGKWHRRSQCITGAEWMIFRFGDGFGGRFAQLVSVVGGVVGAVGMIAYLVKGVGLFLSMFLPFPPLMCALVLIIVATIYTMVSGFYGVVFTDIFQSLIILVVVVFVSITAISKVTDSQSLAALAAEVTGNSNWLSSIPHWYTTMPRGYECYQHLAMFSFFYLLKNMFLGMGMGNDAKYFGARNDRECGTLSFLWSWLMMFRWPLIMGFAVLGLFLVKDLFPDQSVLTQAALLIKQHLPTVEKAQWAEVISDIIHHQQNYSTELIAGLKSLLGETDWIQKLQLLSFEGTVNPERILPAVLLYNIPQGFRGLILVSLLAASMSTFDTTVNGTTGLLTRDVYQKYFRPNASTKELIYMSWLFVFAIVLTGFLFAISLESINDIWGWISMGFWGGMLVPAVLRLYWWRFNGGGFAFGTMIGLIAAILQRIFFPGLDERWIFSSMVFIGLAAAVAGTYLTKPTDTKVLQNFYKTTRPFGFWGPLKNTVSSKIRAKMKREHKYDILAVPFTFLWHVTLLLLPMQLIIHTYKSFWVTLILFAIGLVGMYFLWYRNLSPGQED
jgi:solute:Na+ symporter, SSS family